MAPLSNPTGLISALTSGQGGLRRVSRVGCCSFCGFSSSCLAVPLLFAVHAIEGVAAILSHLGEAVASTTQFHPSPQTNCCCFSHHHYFISCASLGCSVPSTVIRLHCPLFSSLSSAFREGSVVSKILGRVLSSRDMLPAASRRLYLLSFPPLALSRFPYLSVPDSSLSQGDPGHMHC